MSTPNPTHIIAEGMREVATEGQKGTPGTREDGQLWGAFPNTMTIKDLAAHVVSKLTDAGYSIMPTPPLTAEQRDPDGNHIFDQGGDLAICIECGVTRSEHQRARAAAEGEKP